MPWCSQLVSHSLCCDLAFRIPHWGWVLSFCHYHCCERANIHQPRSSMLHLSCINLYASSRNTCHHTCSKVVKKVDELGMTVASCDLWYIEPLKINGKGKRDGALEPPHKKSLNFKLVTLFVAWLVLVLTRSYCPLIAEKLHESTTAT